MKLWCYLFGHKWVPDVGDIYANTLVGGQCKGCNKRTECVGFELDYQDQVLREMIKEDMKQARTYIPNTLY